MVISACTYVQEFLQGQYPMGQRGVDGRILFNWILGFGKHHNENSFTEGKSFLTG